MRFPGSKLDDDARTPTFPSTVPPGALFFLSPSLPSYGFLFYLPILSLFSSLRRSMLGAPNGRVTRDAPLAWPGLAWPGRARLLGAQMMYADHSLSLFLPHVRLLRFRSLRFPCSLFTHLYL